MREKDIRRKMIDLEDEEDESGTMASIAIGLAMLVALMGAVWGLIKLLELPQLVLKAIG